jgi:putative hydrolase of the HAD superfamily
MTPRALLLDAMGTLIGLRSPLGSTYAAAAARHGLTVTAAAVDRAFPAVLRTAPPLAFPGLAGPVLEQAECRWWGDRIDATLAACGAGPAPEALHRELFEAFADPALWRVYDDVPQAMERWHRRGLRLAVVSNFDRRLHPLLRDLGLVPFLDRVIVSSEVGAAKPSALPFQRALEALELQPHQVWHVGDQPEDVEGASRAGVRCLRLRRS